MDVYILLHRYHTFGNALRSRLKGNAEPVYILSEGLNYIKVNTLLLPVVFNKKNASKMQGARILKNIYKAVRSAEGSLGKFDLIHHHGIINNVYITSYLSQKLKIPYIITEHTPFESSKIRSHNPFDNNNDLLNFIRNASQRLAVSNSYAKKYESIFNASFRVLPNLVSDDFIDKVNARKAEKRSFTYISVAYLEEVKNHDLLLKAFAKTLEAYPDNRLLLAGDGTLKEKLMEMAKSLGVGEKVIFMGRLSREATIDAIDSSDVLIVSSLKETFSVVIVEAFFRGVPVVSTRCGGPEDIINESNGLLCNNNDIDDLADKMVRIRKNYSGYSSDKIKSDAIKKYSEKSVCGKLMDIYVEILN